MGSYGYRKKDGQKRRIVLMGHNRARQINADPRFIEFIRREMPGIYDPERTRRIYDKLLGINDVTSNRTKAEERKKMKKSIGIMIVFALFAVLSSLGVIGVECGATPTEDCTVTTSTTFDFGTYYLNDTNGNGAVIIGASNIELDCNGASLVGNFTGSSIGIYNNGKDNTIIKNCVINGYNRNIWNNYADNSTLFNISIGNATTAGIRNSGGIGINISQSSFDNITLGRGINLASSAINSTIEYNNFFNNKDCIYIETSNFTNINNNILINCTLDGIYSDDSSFLIIEDNSIQYIQKDSGGGIWIRDNTLYGDDVGRHSINRNNIAGYHYGIRLENRQPYSNITNNIVNHANGWGISCGDNSSYCLVEYNKVYNDGWNPYHFNSWNNTFRYNYAENWTHNGIDTHSDFNETISGNTSIYGNNLTGTIGGSSMHIANSINNLIYDNYFYNIINDSITTGGISMEGGNYSQNNRIYNNTFINVTKECIRLSGNGTIFDSNTLSNCGTIEVQYLTLSGFGFPDLENTFLNNNYLDGFARFKFNQNNINLSINETSTSFHQLNLTSGRIIKFSYNGRKDFRVENNTITINNMPTSFNQIFNQTSPTPTAENVNTFTETIPSNNRTLVISYLTSTQPKFTSIPLAVTDLTYNYTSSTQTLLVTCTGSGGIVVTNLDSIKGTSSQYDVYRNNVFIETATGNSYTTSSCSTWKFTTRLGTQSAIDSRNSVVATIMDVITFLPIMIIAMIGGMLIILFVFRDKIDLSMLTDSDSGLPKIILSLIGIGILVVIAILILNTIV